MPKLRVFFTGKNRTENLMGEPHLVLPTISIKEGVRNGVLLKADVIQENFYMWDGRPVCYNHPEDSDGWPTYLHEKDVIDRHVIGTVLNVMAVDDGLQWETWINKRRLEEINPGMLQELEAGEVNECSIGYWAEKTEYVAGFFNGEEYWAIDYAMAPDHFAILGEGTIGACSIKDGCGCNRTYKQKDGKAVDRIFRVQSANYMVLQDTGNVVVDNSIESKCGQPWSNANLKRYLAAIGDNEELKKEMFLTAEKMAHHVVIDDKMRVNVDALKGYSSLFNSGAIALDEEAYKHLKRHCNEFNIELNNFDDKTTDTNVLGEIKEMFFKFMNKEKKEEVEDMPEERNEKEQKVLSLTEQIDINVLEKLLTFHQEVGIDKMTAFIEELKAKELREKEELATLRKEMTEEFGVATEVVADMNLTALKFFKEKLSSDKKRDFSGSGGVVDNNGVVKIPYKREVE